MIAMLANPFVRLAFAVTMVVTISVAMYIKGRSDGAAAATLRLNTLTEKAILEIGNAAEKARLMRRHCIDTGQLYDFGTGKCKKAGVDQ